MLQTPPIAFCQDREHRLLLSTGDVRCICWTSVRRTGRVPCIRRACFSGISGALMMRSMAGRLPDLADGIAIFVQCVGNVDVVAEAASLVP